MVLRWLAVVVLGAVAAACGGSSPAPPAAGAADTSRPAETAQETRWLRGLWANDIRGALGPIGVTCQGPTTENRTSVWTCQSGTPLVSYQVRFYGSSPGKIEYINAVVTQSGAAKDVPPLRLFGALAGLHFEGADSVKARQWVKTTLATGGTTEFGPAKCKLAGDANRRTFEIKAKGSDW